MPDRLTPPSRALRALASSFALVAVAALVAACGSDGAAESSSSGGPVTVTDHLGRTVSLDAPAERIVTTEWESTENALALGVTPVGVADKDFYADWVGGGDPIPEEVENVGERHEPSLEKIAALAPDLIIAPRDLPQETRDQLEDFAPLAVVDPYPVPGAGRPSEWENMRSEIVMMGKLLAREQRADEVLAELDRTIAEQRRRIEDAGLAGDSVVITQGFTTGKPVTRLFDDGSQLLEVARRLGLENGFDGERREYSFTEVGLEGLRQVGDADWLLTIAQDDDDPFTDAWAGNPAFQSLPVVERDHVRSLGEDVWTWGGPRSAAYAAERIADALIGSAETT